MKKYFAFLAVVLLVIFQGILTPTNGQWQKNITDDNISTAVDVHVDDVDGDTKLDLVVTDMDGKLIWYQNNFPHWTKHIIDNVGPTFAFAADMDGNDTLDVVACLWSVGKMVWYENKHPTWTKHVIDSNTDDADFMLVGDFNNDDTLDVVTAGGYSNGGDVVWYENNHPNWTKHIIESGSGKYPSLNVNDIDGDGLLDIVATMNTANKVVWFRNENNGQSWTKYTIDNGLIGAFGINSYDIDGDDTVDVVATSRSTNDIIWYENNHPTWTRHIIDANFPGANWPFVTDVDGDGTMDIIVDSYSGNDVVWYENNHPTWIQHIIDLNLIGPRILTSADIDEDKINDVIVAAEGSVVWYKNPNTTVAYGKSLEVYPFLVQPQSDTLTVSARFSNPENHFVNVFTVIQGEQSAYNDTMQLYDDGLHGDGESSDNQWGNIIMADGLPEDVFNVNLISYDLTSDVTQEFTQPGRFITIGPVSYEYHSFTTSETVFHPGETLYIRLTLKNNSTNATAPKIQAKILSLDTLVTVSNLIHDFDAIAAGESSISNGSYYVRISEECPGNTQVPIVVQIMFEDHICWSDTFSIQILPVNTKDTRAPMARIYPNPTNDLLTIETDSPDYYSINITNLNGQPILIGEMEGTSQQIDLSSFQKGIYFITIRSKDFVTTRKIIKM